MRQINKIIIHCTDTPDYNKDGTERNHTVADIDLWHKEKGWSGIGYHYLIDRKGESFNGRPEHKQGAHCSGHNKDSIGVVLVGRSDFNDLQFAELRALVNNLCFKYDLTFADVYGHYEFSNKTCPNFDVRLMFPV